MKLQTAVKLAERIIAKDYWYTAQNGAFKFSQMQYEKDCDTLAKWVTQLGKTLNNL